MNLLSELSELFRLSTMEFNLIQQEIIAVSTRHLRSAEKPVVIILGGQPGAGKTELEKSVFFDYGKNIVSCNADIFRDFHPDAEVIKSNHEGYYPELTSGNAHAWNNGLREHCEKNKFNYILETTFSSGELMNSTIQALKSKGYFVEVRLLAVHPKLSLLGTQARFEHMKQTEKSGRVVSREAHDERFLKIASTVTSVQSAKLYDSIKIFGRNSVSNEHSLTEGIHMIANNPENPLAVFQSEINREWPSKLLAYFNQRVLEVIQLKQGRGVSEHEINEFADLMLKPMNLPWSIAEKSNEISQHIDNSKKAKPHQGRRI